MRRTPKLAALAACSALVGSSFLLAGAATATTTETSYWSMNESNVGDAAVDSVGGNNGVGSGNPAPAHSVDVPYSTPANAGSMQFDGQNYFEVNNTLSADFSICAWIKTSSTGGYNHWENAPIVDSEMGGFAYDYGFGIDAQGKLAFGNGGNITQSAQGDQTISGVATVNDNAWHNVCVTRNNTTGEDILYVDGAQDFVGVTGVGNLVDNAKAWIGNGQDGNAQFVGLIDDVRFYTTVISAADVHEVFSPTAPVVDPVVPEVRYDVKTTLAETGGLLNNALVIGALLVLAGSATIVVAKVRS